MAANISQQVWAAVTKQSRAETTTLFEIQMPGGEESEMTQLQGNRPKPEEVARKVEQLVTQTPQEVMERMKQRLEERRYSTASESGELMTKRAG